MDSTMTSLDEAVSGALAALTARHGGIERDRAFRGLAAAAALWRSEDGDPEAFQSFCETHYAPRGEPLEALFARFSLLAEELYGGALRVSRRAQWGQHVDEGPLLPVDELLAAYDPYAHISEDFFATKLAFVARLNFPPVGLEEKRAGAASWSRRDWAKVRLGELFAERLPAALLQARSAAQARGEAYIASYNFHLSCFRSGDRPLFAEPKRLLMHWNMRDEIKAQYALEGGLERQRALCAAMLRVVDGSVPAEVVDSAEHAWDPTTNKLRGTAGAAPEGVGRYERMLELARAELALDPHSPDTPSLVARRFDRDRELSLAEVESLLGSLFEGPLFARAAALASRRLGRPLEAFDVWYRDFGAGGGAGGPESELDALCRARFPDAAAFEREIPAILRALGFAPAEADWLAARIAVDPARGSGHAMPAAMREDKVRLRTRVGKGGMDYKGFNIAMHELGHNVEQVYSLHGVDEYFLAGVPNTAFTEAFAFVFQARALEILGRAGEARASALEDYWATCEIAGVALCDIAVWKGIYADPGLDAAGLRDLVLRSAREVWNRRFAPAFGLRDSTILGVYSHMIDIPLYLADYPMGHLIAFQIESWLKGKNLGEEMGRLCRLGRLTPGAWLRQGLDQELSARPLIAAAEAEAARLGG